MEIIFFILFLSGQVIVISTVLKGKDYSRIKAILMGVYLFLGINIPFIGYGFLAHKTGEHIPFMSSIIALYQWLLCIIGFVGIVVPIYKTIQKSSALKNEDKEFQSSE